MTAAAKPSRSSGELPSGTVPRANRKAFVPVHPTACGKYTLIAKIGHGGMAEVFLAVASGMAGFRKISVVKRIHPQLLEEPEFVNMFMDEARLAARLNHPNVVTTYEVGEHEGVPFIAMEYMDGQAYDKLLRAVHRAGETMPVKTAVRIAMDSLAGLHYAHELKEFDGRPIGVVHRDISPSNIFVTYQGVVKILDFGIAKATTKLSETRTGQIKGKLSYMAPEQARGKQVDRRADLWSIGVTLFETCTGARLFKGESDVDTLQRVLMGDVGEMLRNDERLPPPLLEVVRRSLARPPEDRYATAAEMRKALEDTLPALEGPDPDLAEFVGTFFEEIAQAQQTMLGELLENADKIREQAESEEADAMVPVVTVTTTSDEARRSKVPFLLGALVLAGILGGAGVSWFISDPEAESERSMTAAAPSSSAHEAARDDRATAPVEPAADDPTPNDPSPSGSAAEPAGGLAGAAEEGDGEAESQPGPGGASEDEAADRRHDTAARRGRALRRARSRLARRRAEEQPEDPGEAAPTQFGTLMLQTSPWSEVYLGTRRLGVTPLRDVRLPVGHHTLLLRNPESNIDTRISVTIEPNQATRLNIGL